jgi:hypothetical protein
MTPTISAGPPAQPADRSAARQNYLLVQNELPRVRETALAWRNGVGAILVGLAGFGLIKGRADIGELASPYNAVVGILLLAALFTGGTAAILLLRAAHGRTMAMRNFNRSSQSGLLSAADHSETLNSARALTWGVSLAMLSACLLCAAVGTTWYGPAKDDPRLEVLTPDGPRCGEIVRLAAGKLTLKTNSGEIIVDLVPAVGIRAVDSCTPATM